MSKAPRQRLQNLYQVIARTLHTMPLSSLATTARAEEDSATAASTLSFIHPGGGGSHLNTAGAAKEGFSDSSKLKIQGT